MSLHDHSSGGDLIFPGEASGTVFRLQSLELFNNDDDEKPDCPEGDVRGNWVKVLDLQREKMMFMSAPGEMIEELQRLQAQQGDGFEVTRCEKSGPRDTDPYEVNLESLDEHGQESL